MITQEGCVGTPLGFPFAGHGFLSLRVLVGERVDWFLFFPPFYWRELARSGLGFQPSSWTSLIMRTKSFTFMGR